MTSVVQAKPKPKKKKRRSQRRGEQRRRREPRKTKQNCTFAVRPVWLLLLLLCISCRTRLLGLPCLFHPLFHNLSYIHLTVSFGFLLIYLLSKLCCSKNLTTYFISVTFSRAHSLASPSALALCIRWPVLCQTFLPSFGRHRHRRLAYPTWLTHGSARTAAHCAHSTNSAARKSFAVAPMHLGISASHVL